MQDARRLLPLTVTIAASMILTAGAIPAAATAQDISSVFADCPAGAPGVTLCISGQITGGEISVGGFRVPIDGAIALQGGAIPIAQNYYYLVPGNDGSSISGTELSVPGGLPSLLRCDALKGHGPLASLERAACRAVSGHRAAEVTVVAEPVPTASNPATVNVAQLFLGEKPGMALPIRIHVKNVLLGKSCYIGSAADPIELNLTTGRTSPPPPNQPIEGTLGHLTFDEEVGNEMLSIEGISLVDNSFSAPTAEGCGGIFAPLVDPIVDRELGLPSASGHNTVIMSGTLDSAWATEVLAGESS